MLTQSKYKELATKLEENGEVKFADEGVLVHVFVSCDSGYITNAYEIDKFDFEDADNNDSANARLSIKAIDAVQLYKQGTAEEACLSKIYTVTINFVFGKVDEVKTFVSKAEAEAFVLEWGNKNSLEGTETFTSSDEAIGWFYDNSSDVDAGIDLFETEIEDADTAKKLISEDEDVLVNYAKSYAIGTFTCDHTLPSDYDAFMALKSWEDDEDYAFEIWTPFEEYDLSNLQYYVKAEFENALAFARKVSILVIA